MHQLRNGTWVDLGAVVKVRADDAMKPGEFAGSFIMDFGPIPGPRVTISFAGSTGTEVVDCETYEAACAYCDELAARVLSAREGARLRAEGPTYVSARDKVAFMWPATGVANRNGDAFDWTTVEKLREFAERQVEEESARLSGRTAAAAAGFGASHGRPLRTVAVKAVGETKAEIERHAGGVPTVSVTSDSGGAAATTRIGRGDIVARRGDFSALERVEAGLAYCLWRAADGEPVANWFAVADLRRVPDAGLRAGHAEDLRALLTPPAEPGLAAAAAAGVAAARLASWPAGEVLADVVTTPVAGTPTAAANPFEKDWSEAPPAADAKAETWLDRMKADPTCTRPAV